MAPKSHAAATMCASCAELRYLFFIPVCHNRAVCKRSGSEGLTWLPGVCAVGADFFAFVIFFGGGLFFFYFFYFKCFVAHKAHFSFECLCEHQSIHYALSSALCIRQSSRYVLAEVVAPLAWNSDKCELCQLILCSFAFWSFGIYDRKGVANCTSFSPCL